METSNQIRLAILSPAYPPAVNGLGDYATRLGKALDEFPGMEVHYIGLPQDSVVKLKPYHVSQKDAGHFIELLERLEITHLLINYSNYGYQLKGTPFWLIKAVRLLKAVKSPRRQVKVITFFHELYATGMPWQSVYWLKLLQRRLFRELYRNSDHSFCSNERVEMIITSETNDAGKKNLNIGIFSNIPEPCDKADWTQCADTAVVFGTIGRRQPIYDQPEQLNRIIQELGIRKLVDVGRGKPDISRLNCSFEVLGEQPAEKIDELLCDARWGFIDYPDSLLGKSGIFAAYAAHGLAVVNFTEDPTSPLDKLQRDVHFYKAGAESFPKPEQTAANLLQWYGPRNLNNHCKQILITISNQQETLITI